MRDLKWWQTSAESDKWYLLDFGVYSLTHFYSAVADQYRTIFIYMHESSRLRFKTQQQWINERKCIKHKRFWSRMLEVTSTWLRKPSENPMPYLMGTMAIPLFLYWFCWLKLSMACRRRRMSAFSLHSFQQRTRFSGSNSIL